jgi:signal transduction histidine kinase/CheY-like chemotaxis protein
MRERLGLYFLLAVLIPLGLGTLVSERLIERHITALARGAATERLDMVLERLEDQGRFLRIELGLASAAVAPVLDDEASLTELLHGPSMGRKFDFLWVATPDGRLLGRGIPARRIGAGLAAPPIVAKALAGDTIISYEEVDPTLLPASRRKPGDAAPLAHAVAVPVRDDRENVVAALVGGVVLTGNDAVTTQLLDQGSSTVAIAHRGVLVAGKLVGPDGSSRARAGGTLSAAEGRAIARNERWVGPTGTSGFSALEPLVDSSGRPVGAVLVRTSTARFANLKADARGSFIMAMGAGAMIALLLALLAARQITGPLRRLAQAAAAMEKGRLDVTVPVEGNDEVAQLAVALKRTAGALSESMSTLESRVRERTAQLEEARDVLEEQRRELEEKTRRSEEADRLKNAFIANMSHEIRTPLNSVLALSQLLRDGMGGPLTLDQNKYLEVIERNGQNLLRLINDILDLSRIEAGHLEMDVRSADLGPIIRETVATLLPLSEAKGLDVQVKVPDTLPPVRCDVDRVQQVLTNLVGNAIKFTEAGQVQVSAEARNGAVAIHVTDTGVGIPQALTSKIFQEFFQVDQTLARRQGGTGLGLAIASRLARLMGGDITVESVVGSGSRFTLTLPRGGAADERRLPEAAADGGSPVEGRVLVVDDDDVDRRATIALLEGAGLRVVGASSGAEAVQAFGEQRFDAVVLDLFMPGLNGFDVLGEARQDRRLAQVPFIVITAHDLTSADREGLAAPVFGFVRKGESMRAGLVAMVRKALKTRAAAGPGAPLPPRSASILLVEDNEDNLFTLRQILNGVAVELASASSGREAIDYCRRRRPDLIIMDMQMPGMSGLQATGAIRALPGGAAIPIVALTAQAMKGDRERILAAGCDEYLAKPIQPKVLLSVVERLLGPRETEAPEVPAEGGAPGPEVARTKGQHGTHTPRR